MYAEIVNENYGYAVATHGAFVAVGNPAIGRYTADTASYYRTGSVDIFRYDPMSDEHLLVSTLYGPYAPYTILLAIESASRDRIHTEENGIVGQADLDLAVNTGIYSQFLEDGYGLSLDIYNKKLVVGAPYWKLRTTLPNFTNTTSGSIVDIFDLSAFEKDRYNSPNFSEFTKSYITTLENPNTDTTESFGRSVSINGGWIAVGSPYYSASHGAVYMFRNASGDGRTWSYFQRIVPPLSASLSSRPQYGADVALNKQSGSYSGSLVIGVGNPSSSVSLIYEYSASAWRFKQIFTGTHATQSLTFGGYTPHDPVMNTSDGFGTAVGIYEDTLVVGAPYDRTVQEFSGSSRYYQGAGYIYERCPNPDEWQLVLKTHGNDKVLKNNRLGYCADVHGSRAAFGLPKINVTTMDSCYIGGTVTQLHFCEGDRENTLSGQFAYLEKTSGSWDITNIYQRKKKFLIPYRGFGASVSVGDFSTVVGAPMMVTDRNRYVNYDVPSGSHEFDDLAGKAYIYNHKNFREEVNVGNVFYRNGKIILMTSGSVFDGLLYNPISSDTYEYELDFRSQRTIYEKQIVCTVEPGEFNVSTNPTAVTQSRALFDINGNGKFDFQDADVILRYMQYVHTRNSGEEVSTDWSSSIVTADDEQSLLRYHLENADEVQTNMLTSASIYKWEFVDTSMQTSLDANQDGRIDERDLNIVWKYFSNRLTQQNYSTYITPTCQRKLFSDVIDYMDGLSGKNERPQILSAFADYERLSANDKTGSYLAPYATTIGLYNGLDLVAVAKLGTPIKLVPELPINFVVKMDF